MEKYNLPYLEALEKVIGIVKRDAKNLKGEKGEFDVKTQIENLMDAYGRDIDPDTALEKINAVEENQKTLLEDVAFILKTHFVQARNLHHHPNRRFNFTDGIRLQHLMSKYQLQHERANVVVGWNIQPVRFAFPDVEYNVLKENPSFCRGLPDEMKRYKNFKREYDVDGIFALLPPNKQYGGFVKAYLNLQILVMCDQGEMLLFGNEFFQAYLGRLRMVYNSSIYSTEKRTEWFAKLGIQEKDCALWSRLFDQQYPGYKEVHKFFEQVA